MFDFFLGLPHMYRKLKNELYRKLKIQENTCLCGSACDMFIVIP